MANYQIEEMDRADRLRKAYAALDYFNDHAPRNDETQKQIDNLYTIVHVYEGKTETPQEKPKPVRYVMTITFYRIPTMGTGSARLIQYLNELAERHNVTIEAQGDSRTHDNLFHNEAEIYYLDRKDADAAMDELYKANAGPRISSTGTRNDSAYQ